MTNPLNIPIKVAELYQPDIIMIRNWPRFWSFKCASCNRDCRKFGWFGFVRCYWCNQLHAPKWNFSEGGY